MKPLVLISLLCAGVLFGGLAPACADLSDQLAGGEVRVVTHLRDIDARALAALTHRFKGDHRLADRGAPFAGGDAMLPGPNPPSRRLVLAATTSSGIWFIHYEHGGIGLHSHLVALARSGRAWRVVYAAVGFYEYPTLPELRAAIGAQQFTASHDEL